MSLFSAMPLAIGPSWFGPTLFIVIIVVAVLGLVAAFKKSLDVRKRKKEGRD